MLMPMEFPTATTNREFGVRTHSSQLMQFLKLSLSQGFTFRNRMMPGGLRLLPVRVLLALLTTSINPFSNIPTQSHILAIGLKKP